jgi:hypothetical protein
VAGHVGIIAANPSPLPLVGEYRPAAVTVVTRARSPIDASSASATRARIADHAGSSSTRAAHATATSDQRADCSRSSGEGLVAP